MAREPLVGHGGPERSAGQPRYAPPPGASLRHRGARRGPSQSRRRRRWSPNDSGGRGTRGSAHRDRLVGAHADGAGGHRNVFGELAVGRHRRAAHVAGRFGEGMSADASRRISALAPPWLRYGLIAGIIAFSCTLTANLAVTWLSPADLCRVGFIVPLLSLGALIIFLAMAAAAGFKTARVGAPTPDPTLAGLLVAMLAGCALLVLLPFATSAEHRFQEVAAACAGPAVSGGGSFSFNFGPMPPPGVFIPTRPPSSSPHPLQAPSPRRR